MSQRDSSKSTTKKLKSSSRWKRVMRQIFLNILFLVLFTVLILTGLEIYLRRTCKITNEFTSAVGVRIFQPSALNSFENKPLSSDINGYGDPTPTIQINELGLRGESLKAEIGKNNLLLLGDSFTFGAGVRYEETFASLLQRKLGPDWKTQNAGTIGTTVDNYYLNLKKYSAIFNPKIAVVNLFVGNDITELRRHQWSLGADGDLESVRDTDIFVDSEGRLRSWKQKEPLFYCLDWLGNRWKILKAKMGLPVVDKNTTLTWPAFMPEGHVGYDPRMPDFWIRFFKMMDSMQQWGGTHGIKIVFAILPMDVQVSKNYWKKYTLVPRLFDDEAFSARRPQTKIMDYCKQRHLLCLDLLPPFQQNKNQDTLYFRNEDPHFDLNGHKATADSIYQFLTETKLIL